MNGLAELLLSFDVSILFTVSHRLATAVATYLSPVLLIVSIHIRIMETQVDALVGTGKYGTAIRDIALWTFVLGAYFAIGNYLVEFLNPIYAWVDSFGSLQATMGSFEKILEKNRVDSLGDSVSMINVVSSPYLVIAMFLYYASLVVVAFMSVFLKIANVMTFGFAFIWGLVAIPISISTTFRILRGWALLLGFAIAWPFVQGLLMAMFAMLFTNAADVLVANPDAATTLRAANLMMLFAVMHLLLGAVLVSAPFIANAVVANVPAASGIVMPFVGAAAAAGLAAVKGKEVTQSGLGGSLRNATGGGTAGTASFKVGGGVRQPAARAATAAFAKTNDVKASPGSSPAPAATAASAPVASRTPAAAPAATPTTHTPATPASQPTSASAARPLAATPVAGSGPVYRAVSSPSAGVSQLHAAADPAAGGDVPDAPKQKTEQQQRQQRRGVVLNQIKRNNAKRV